MKNKNFDMERWILTWKIQLFVWKVKFAFCEKFVLYENAVFDMKRNFWMRENVIS